MIDYYSSIYGVFQNLYQYHYNTCELPNVYKFPLLGWVYLLIFVLALFNRKRILNIALIIFCIFILFQTLSQYRSFIVLQKKLDPLTTTEKETLIIGPSHRFGEFGFNQFRGHRYKGRLISGFSLSETLEPYAIKYDLYPVVDLINEYEDPDCLVIFEKKNAKNLVPPDFHIVAIFGETSLFAIKKSLTHVN